MWKLLKHYFMPEYVSRLDQFLQEFDREHPTPSASQRKEEEKFSRIFYLRDHAKAE